MKTINQTVARLLAVSAPALSLTLPLLATRML